MTLHQGGIMTVVGAAHQIALPMTGNAVFNLRRPFSDREGIYDLSVISAITGVLRVAYPPLEAKVLNKLFFQHSSRLYQ
jgi:hypothetical protein